MSKRNASESQSVRGRKAKSTGGVGKLGPHECLICSKVCNSYHALELHTNLHTEEEPYNCPECDASFRDYRSIWGHRKLNHAQIKRTCKFCGQKCFADLSGFHEHQKTCSAKGLKRISAKENKSLVVKAAKERKQGGKSDVEAGQVGVATWDASFFLHMNRYVPDS